jgi:hypothetical protein
LAILIATLIIAALVIAQIGSNQVIAEQNAAATRDAQAAATIVLQATAEATARIGAEAEKLRAESAATAEASARVTAEWNAKVAEVEKVRADREAEVAIRQGNIALARQLAAQTHSSLDRGLSDELSLLLAVEAARAGRDASAFVLVDDALRRAFAVAPLVIIRHEGEVLDVVFSADSTHLATRSDDGTARLVKVETGEEVALIRHEGPVWDVVFSPDGAHLATASTDGTVKLRTIEADILIRRICHIVSRTLTQREWDTYVGAEIPYRSSCQDLAWLQQ